MPPWLIACSVRLWLGKLPSQKVYEDDTVLAFGISIPRRLRSPFWVIPKEQTSRVSPPASPPETARWWPTARKRFSPAGQGAGGRLPAVSNCGLPCGQTVPHLHFHLLRAVLAGAGDGARERERGYHMETDLKPNAGQKRASLRGGVQLPPLRPSLHSPDHVTQDNIRDAARQYGAPLLAARGCALYFWKSGVACTQKRAIPMEEIHPRKLAYTLSKHVTKTPHGIGLGMPETMEYALRECGTLRILFAAFVSVIGKKLFRKKGWFYKVAGYKARSIDGPCHNTIPPYNHYVVLGPVNPDQVARDIKARIGFETCIVDINDLEGQMWASPPRRWTGGLYARILKDNPLGQDDQQTLRGHHPEHWLVPGTVKPVRLARGPMI
ncbi:MAG: HIT domain-containing protein [Oscillospiraceae bacterium]